MDLNIPHILQGRELLRRNAVYIDYPILDENGSVQATRGKRLVFFFDKYNEDLAQKQQHAAMSFMMEKPNEFCFSYNPILLKSDFENEEFKRKLEEYRKAHPDMADKPDKELSSLLSLTMNGPAHYITWYNLTHAQNKFETLFGKDVGVNMRVDDNQAKERFRLFQDRKKEALTYFGGRKNIPEVEFDVLLESDPERHDRYEEIYISSGEEPGPEDCIGPMMKEFPLHEATNFYYSDSNEILEAAQLAFFGIESGYKVTRQHNITQTRS